MLKFPVTALVNGCEFLTGAMRAWQRAFNYGVDTLMGGLAQFEAAAAESSSSPVATPLPGDEVDQSLEGDDLKLVKYRILQVRRDREHVVHFDEDLVNYSTTTADYAARVLREYVERHPETLKHPEDEKFLRTFVRVIARYPRGAKEYDKDQVEVLREIRDEIRETGARI
jgi:hypothetical protein